MGADHHARAPALEDGDRLQQGVLADDVDAVERLVQQQQPRLGGDRPRQQHSLALPTRQRAEPVARTLGEAHLLQRLRRRRAIGPARASEPADLPVTAHHHDLLDRDGEVGVESVGLGHVGDVAACQRGSTAQHLDPASDDRDQAEDCLDEGRLARPVGADQRDGLARVDDAVDLLQHRHVAVRDAGVLHSQRDVPLPGRAFPGSGGFGQDGFGRGVRGNAARRRGRGSGVSH